MQVGAHTSRPGDPFEDVVKASGIGRPMNSRPPGRASRTAATHTTGGDTAAQCPPNVVENRLIERS